MDSLTILVTVTVQYEKKKLLLAFSLYFYLGFDRKHVLASQLLKSRLISLILNCDLRISSFFSFLIFSVCLNSISKSFICRNSNAIRLKDRKYDDIFVGLSFLPVISSFSWHFIVAN